MLEPSLRSPDVQVLRPACSSSWMSDESWTASGHSISKLDCPKNCLSTCCPSCKLCNAALHASPDAETRNDDASLSVAGAISALRLPWNDAIRSIPTSFFSWTKSWFWIPPKKIGPADRPWNRRTIGHDMADEVTCKQSAILSFDVLRRRKHLPIHERKKVPQAYTTWCPSEAFWS